MSDNVFQEVANMNDKQRKALRSWSLLNQLLGELTEKEVQEILKDELSQQQPRWGHVERMHQRFCILRSKRERAEMGL